MKHIVFLGGLGALVLAGCASTPKVSAEQCMSQDWFAVGKAHGTAGQPMTAINDAVNLCAPHGIVPDLDAYKAGRAEGLVTYCAPTSLVDATLQGKGDPFACEPFTPTQKTAFETGRDTRAAAARYQQIKAQYDQLVQQKAQINQEGSRLTQLYNQTSDQTQRNQIGQQLTQLRKQLAQVEEQLKQADPVMRTEETTYQTAVKSYESYKAGLAQ